MSNTCINVNQSIAANEQYTFPSIIWGRKNRWIRHICTWSTFSQHYLTMRRGPINTSSAHVYDTERLQHQKHQKSVVGNIWGNEAVPAVGLFTQKWSHTPSIRTYCATFMQKKHTHTQTNPLTTSPREKSRSQIALLRSVLIGGKIRWLWVRLVKKHCPSGF